MEPPPSHPERSAAGARRPRTEPEARITQVVQLTIGTVTMTAITRRWGRQDTRRCRRCPKGCCTAVWGSCTVLVGIAVSEERAKDYRIESILSWRDMPGG